MELFGVCWCFSDFGSSLGFCGNQKNRKSWLPTSKVFWDESLCPSPILLGLLSPPRLAARR